MPPAVWFVLAVALLATAVALALAVRKLFRRLVLLGSDLHRLRGELTPALHQLQADGEVTANELAAIGDRLEERARRAATRSRRRWRPGPS